MTYPELSSPEIVQRRTSRVVWAEIADQHEGVSYDVLMSYSRKHWISRARHHLFFCLWIIENKWSLPLIGMVFGLDHTSVMYGIRKHAHTTLGTPMTAGREEIRAAWLAFSERRKRGEGGSMMDKVISIRGGALSDPRNAEPNQETIERLERLLSDARSGALQLISYQSFYHDGTGGYGWTSRTKEEFGALVFEAELMKQDGIAYFLETIK